MLTIAGVLLCVGMFCLCALALIAVCTIGYDWFKGFRQAILDRDAEDLIGAIIKFLIFVGLLSFVCALFLGGLSKA